MANAWVTEFKRDHFQGNPILREPANASQTLSYTSSDTLAAAFQADTEMVRIVCDSDSYMEFGTDPTATNASERVTADVEYIRFVDKGIGLNVAFLAA